MKNDTITRKISYKEFKQESEGTFKFFRLKYYVYHNILPKTGEFQHKDDVERIINSPTTMSFELYVVEWVDSP